MGVSCWAICLSLLLETLSCDNDSDFGILRGGITWLSSVFPFSFATFFSSAPLLLRPKWFGAGQGVLDGD